MFFYFSKILWLFAAPTNFMLLALGFGLLAGWLGFARSGKRIMAAAALALLVCGLSPLGTLLLQPLEERFPQVAADMPPPTGIIVLGGGIDEGLTFERNSVSLTEAGSRMSDAVALARRFPQARLVFSGGSAALLGSRVTESDAAKRMWSELGIAPERMEFESRSRNTAENAGLLKEMLHPAPGEVWLLVTSAFHMPRSVGIFRKIGFPVTPWPDNYLTRPWPKSLRPHINAVENLTVLDRAVREWVGLAAYYLSGRTEALFPAPDPVKN